VVRILTLDGVRTVPLIEIERARLTGYHVDQTVDVWTFPGVLLTATNGWLLAVTAPRWLLTGTLSTHDVWSKAKSSHPRRSWEDLRLYARYPAGWPAGLDPATVRPDARWPRIACLREEGALID